MKKGTRHAGVVPLAFGRPISPYDVAVIDCHDDSRRTRPDAKCLNCTDRYPYAIVVVGDGKPMHYLSHGLSDARADDLRALARLAFSIGLELGRKEKRP